MALNPQTAAFLATLFAGVDPEAPVRPPSPATSRAGYLGIAAAFGPGPALKSVHNTPRLKAHLARFQSAFTETMIKLRHLASCTITPAAG